MQRMVHRKTEKMEKQILRRITLVKGFFPETLVILVCIPVLCGVVHAKNLSISLQEAVRYAQAHSHAYMEEKEKANQIQASADQAVAFAKPRIGVSGGYLEMGTNAEDPPFAFLAPPDRSVSLFLEASQILFAGGRIWDAFRLKKRLYTEADLLKDAGARNLEKEVRDAFDAVLYQQAALEIVENRLAQRLAETEDAKDLYAVGMVTSLDLRLAKMNTNISQDEKNAAIASYESALIAFNRVIGTPEEEEKQVPEGNLTALPDMSALFHQLKKKQETGALLDIAQMEARVQSAKIGHEMAKGEWFPEVVFTSRVKTEGEKMDETDESWFAGIQVQFDLYDGGEVSAGKARTLSKYRETLHAKQRTEKEITAGINTLIVNYQSLENRILLQKEAAQLAMKNYEDARGQYRAGTITLTQVGDFNLTYAEARFNLLRLYYEMRKLVTQAYALIADGEGLQQN